MNAVCKDGGVIRLLAAGTLVLFAAACSSGGVRNDRDMYKEQAENLASELEMLKEELATATGDRDQALSDIEDAQARLENLDAEVMRLNQWITDLTAARDQYMTALEALQNKGRDEDVEQIRNLMGQIETLDDRIAGLQNDVATLTGERDAIMEEVEGDGTADNPGLRQRISDLQAAKDELEAERDEAARMAAEALRLRNADLLDAALKDPRDRVSVGTDIYGDGRADWANLAVTRDADTVTVSLAPRFDNDGIAAASTDDGWTPVMLSQNDDEGDRTVLVVTNMEAPAPAMFNTVYPAEIRLRVLSGTTDADIARRSVAMADLFPTEPSVSRSYGGTSPVYDASFMGTLHGVEGEYECMVDTGCTVSRDADGALVASDGWRFKPISNVETIMLPDPEWAYYGWWFKRGDAWDFEVRWAGNTFQVTGFEVIRPITGTASYHGTARGKYVFKTYEGGMHTDSNYGDFTADASLEADFADAATDGTIEGSITGFVLNSERSVPWSVTLQSSLIAHSTTTVGTTSADFGTGENDDVGRWTAGFYELGASEYPDTLVGEFDVVTPGASMQGSFGTSRVVPPGN